MLFKLTHFHIHWRISVLQDTEMENMENVIKVHNQTRCNVDSCKETKKRPTYLVNLGLKHTGTWPRPNNQSTREGRLGGGWTRGRLHPQCLPLGRDFIHVLMDALDREILPFEIFVHQDQRVIEQDTHYRGESKDIQVDVFHMIHNYE